MIAVRTVHLDTMKIGKRRFRKDRAQPLSAEAFVEFIETKEGKVSVAKLALKSGALELSIDGRVVKIAELADTFKQLADLAEEIRKAELDKAKAEQATLADDEEPTEEPTSDR